MKNIKGMWVLIALSMCINADLSAQVCSGNPSNYSRIKPGISDKRNQFYKNLKFRTLGLPLSWNWSSEFANDAVLPLTSELFGKNSSGVQFALVALDGVPIFRSKGIPPEMNEWKRICAEYREVSARSREGEFDHFEGKCVTVIGSNAPKTVPGSWKSPIDTSNVRAIELVIKIPDTLNELPFSWRCDPADLQVWAEPEVVRVGPDSLVTMIEEKANNNDVDGAAKMIAQLGQYYPSSLQPNRDRLDEVRRLIDANTAKTALRDASALQESGDLGDALVLIESALSDLDLDEETRELVKTRRDEITALIDVAKENRAKELLDSAEMLLAQGKFNDAEEAILASGELWHSEANKERSTTMMAQIASARKSAAQSSAPGHKMNAASLGGSHPGASIDPKTIRERFGPGVHHPIGLMQLATEGLSLRPHPNFPNRKAFFQARITSVLELIQPAMRLDEVYNGPELKEMMRLIHGLDGSGTAVSLNNLNTRFSGKYTFVPQNWNTEIESDRDYPKEGSNRFFAHATVPYDRWNKLRTFYSCVSKEPIPPLSGSVSLFGKVVGFDTKRTNLEQPVIVTILEIWMVGKDTGWDDESLTIISE